MTAYGDDRPGEAESALPPLPPVESPDAKHDHVTSHLEILSNLPIYILPMIRHFAIIALNKGVPHERNFLSG